MEHRQRTDALCGSSVGEVVTGHEVRTSARRADMSRHEAIEQNAKALYNSREPAQMLANLEGITVEAAFILKDLHRHMDDPVVVRRLRDVGQRFATNRKTIVLTAPEDRHSGGTAQPGGILRTAAAGSPTAAADHRRNRWSASRKTHTLQRKLDAAGLDAIAENLRGLTEEEAERAISQALVARYALGPEIVTDVLEAKKALLKRSEMLEFVEASDNMAGRWWPGKSEAVARRSGAERGKTRRATSVWSLRTA